MQEIIWIVLPPIPKVLQPNCTVATMGGRMQKASATKKQRRLTAEAIEQEQLDTLPWSKCEVSARFYWKTKGRHDIDNAMGSLKSVYDGLVDAGVADDDDPEHMVRIMPEFDLDQKYPRVEITVRRLM